jgi:hypothetical protein
MQLLLDPVVDVGVHDLLEVAGTGAEGETVEGVEGALLLG